MNIIDAPKISYSIHELNLEYARQLGLPSTVDFPNPELEAARFELTGYDAREEKRARVETLRYALTEDSPIPEPMRDYDSLLGFTEHLSAYRSLHVYVVPNPKDQLEKSLGVHVKFCLPASKKVVWLDPGCVPHATLARFDQQYMVRLFFPGLYESRQAVTNRSTWLTADEFGDLYDLGIRPAVKAMFPESLHQWPATYKAELFRSRFHVSGFSNSPRIIREKYVHDFGERLRHHLSEDVPWARNMVFQVQMRGVKLGYKHKCTREDAEYSLFEFTSDLNTNSGQWWVDVGLEYMDLGRALIPRTDAHHHLVAAALQIPTHQAAALTATTQMKIDPQSHFTALSGFRLRIKKVAEQGGPFEAPYLQVYTTDKQVTYLPEKGHFGKFIEPQMAMNGIPPKFCENLMSAYKDARGLVDAAVRIEIRVPLAHAANVLLGLPDDVMRRSIVSMRREIWWDLRISKLHACTTLLCGMNQMPPMDRCNPATLQLYAGICYYINGLHSRPLDDRTGRTIAKCVLPLTSDLNHADRLTTGPSILTPDDSFEGIPFAPGGMAWLRHITIPPESELIAFAMTREMSDIVFERYFGEEEEKLRSRMERITKKALGLTGRRGRPKESKKKRVDAQNEANDGQDQVSVPQLPGDNIPDAPSPPPAPDVASDEPAVEELPDSLLTEVDRIFSMYLVNIMEVLGDARRGNGSYTVLDSEARKHLVLEDYQTASIGHIFDRIQWKRPAVSYWEERFSLLFPRKGFQFKSATQQHYHRLAYRQEWISFVDSLPDTQLDAVLQAMLRKFNQLAWIPHATSDRVWVMKIRKCHTRLPPDAEAAVRILWSPHRSDEPNLLKEREVKAPEAPEEEPTPSMAMTSQTLADTPDRELEEEIEPSQTQVDEEVHQTNNAAKLMDIDANDGLLFPEGFNLDEFVAFSLSKEGWESDAEIRKRHAEDELDEIGLAAWNSDFYLLSLIDNFPKPLAQRSPSPTPQPSETESDVDLPGIDDRAYSSMDEDDRSSLPPEFEFTDVEMDDGEGEHTGDDFLSSGGDGHSDIEDLYA